MNKVQEDKLKEAFEMLSEHFDHVCLIVETESPIAEAEVVTNTFQALYHGGLTTAIGLAERAKHKWFLPKEADRDNFI